MRGSKPCVFCKIVAQESPAAEILRNDRFVVIMDKYPINFGHTLVIPRKHYENLLEMPVEEVAALYSLVPAIAKAVVAAVKADGFNVGQNNGIAANQIVPHVHVHVVPRFNDDSSDGRWPSRQVATHDDLRRTAIRISQSLPLAK